MKDFSQFIKRVQNSQGYKNRIRNRVRGELAQVPAIALLGANSANKLVDVIADVSLEICMTMLKAYHEWMEEEG